jgi:aryl-alcohol dehydrogenase-like predicted oxidoreductase
LGTAQWGEAYGVTNTVGRLSDAEVAQIMTVALAAEIKSFDTAAGYGDAQGRLQPWAANLQITTKVSGAGPRSVKEQLESSLISLGRSEVEIVLVHDWDSLTPQVRSLTAAALGEVKEAGLASLVGVSVYDEAALEFAAEVFESLDVAQVPANAIDRRLDTSELVSKLWAAGTKFQVRSAFLQGLLAASGGTDLGNHVDVESFHEFALAHVRALPWADNIIVGVTSPAELTAIIKAWHKVPAALAPLSISSSDSTLIDPRAWPERSSG